MKNAARFDKFDKRIKNAPARILSKILEIDGYKTEWIQGAKLSPQVLGRLKKSVLITSAGASTRIEGASLSDEDVGKLIKGISIQKFTDRDKQEVQGYYELLQNIFNAWKNIKFSENTIKHFHKELLKYTAKDAKHRGEYKKIENQVEAVDNQGKVIGIIFKTSPAYLAPKQTQELIEWTSKALEEKRYHPLLIISNFLVEFLKIHPFQDGNGRLSRVLANLLLLQADYLYMPYVSHEKLIEDNKQGYYMALRKGQKNIGAKKNNITPWLDFFLTIFLKQSQMAAELLSKENIEKLLSDKQLAVWRYLQKVDQASPGEISKEAKVARPTVNQVLYKLMRLKKVERIGLGRSTRYRKLKP
ncbi:Fic family protein [Patescibacteria group bacterium]|nr:Fic family protein [Patescibacteria group bacterium]MBU4600699.1 Fic family protein [Patescibacteria group bacterium]MCG2698645.1 Fic family protein [Candidatus Parcubacteria bacterium]